MNIEWWFCENHLWHLRLVLLIYMCLYFYLIMMRLHLCIKIIHVIHFIHFISFYMLMSFLNYCCQMWCYFLYYSYNELFFLFWFKRNMVCNHFWDCNSKRSCIPPHKFLRFNIFLNFSFCFYLFPISNLFFLFSMVHGHPLDAHLLLSKTCYNSSLVLLGPFWLFLGFYYFIFYNHIFFLKYVSK